MLDAQSYNTKSHNRVYNAFARRWIRFWMGYAGLNRFGRLATRFASWLAPPHKARIYLARMNPRGYIDPSATVYHSQIKMGANVFIGDHVIIFEKRDGGAVELGDRVNIFRHTIMETAYGGTLTLE